MDFFVVADPESAPALQIDSVANMRVSAIRVELAARGLPTSGKKEELVARLRGALTKSEVHHPDHQMKLVDAVPKEYSGQHISCDGCDKLIDVAAGFYHCEDCGGRGYDECPVCFKEGQAVETAKHAVKKVDVVVPSPQVEAPAPVVSAPVVTPVPVVSPVPVPSHVAVSSPVPVVESPVVVSSPVPEVSDLTAPLLAAQQDVDPDSFGSIETDASSESSFVMMDAPVDLDAPIVTSPVPSVDSSVAPVEVVVDDDVASVDSDQKVAPQQDIEVAAPVAVPSPVPVEPVPVAVPAPAPKIAIPEKSKWPTQLTSLAEMGFTDMELNEFLLGRHNGDCAQVITRLLANVADFQG